MFNVVNCTIKEGPTRVEDIMLFPSAEDLTLEGFDYRPLALTSSTMKTMERLLAHHIRLATLSTHRSLHSFHTHLLVGRHHTFSIFQWSQHHPSIPITEGQANRDGSRLF